MAPPLPPAALAYGAVVFPGENTPRPAVLAGDQVLDVLAVAKAELVDRALVPAFAARTLNPFLATGRDSWVACHQRLVDLLIDGTLDPFVVSVGRCRTHLPIDVADYVDFYSSREHAENLGRILRPGTEPLLPNWLHLPVGYHGRAGTVVVSGTPITRPSGQRGPGDFGPTQRLDIELELGFVVGVGSTQGRPVDVEDAADHVFGVALVNDWSARDIQAWEYQPLGPFLGKSFATSMAAWITPLFTLDSVRVDGPAQDPDPLPYLRTNRPQGLDLDVEAWLQPVGADEPERICAAHTEDLYWTIAQQVSHLTVNGASLRTGDLLASGTISSRGEAAQGSLIELTHNGESPISIAGQRRAFLEDGDEVTLRGSAMLAGTRLELPPVQGRIVPG